MQIVHKEKIFKKIIFVAHFTSGIPIVPTIFIRIANAM